MAAPVTPPPTSQAVFGDLFALWLTWAPGIGAYALAAWTVAALWPYAGAAAVVPAPFALLAGFLALTALIRLALPRLKRGSYVVGRDRMVIVWYCHLALSRGAAAAGIRPLIHTMYLTRWLYYRALGVKIGFGVNMSMGAAIGDGPLISVGTGSTLSEGSFLVGHTFSGEKLLLGTVEIGRCAYVGMDTTIGLSSRLADGARVGMGNLVYAARLGEGEVIEDFAWARGNPAKPQ